MSINWQRSEPQPALVVHPPGAVSLDEAHAAIEQWEHYSGRVLDSAQRLAVEHMLAESAAMRWAARTTCRTMPRQNGKGDEIEVVEAWCLTQRGEAIVHTAHEIPTAKKAHERLVAHIEGHRDLRRLRKQVRYANGDQGIEMHNGGIIVYRTRTGAGARGLDDFSRLVVDEAQHAQREQLASSTPILSANPNPQTNFLGSAGITDKSSWWWEMRRRALSPDPGEFAWLEHSAERLSLDADGRVISVKPDPGDRDEWSTANPAFPTRIDAGFLAEQLRLLGPAAYSREHLGVWDADLTQGVGVFDFGMWEATLSPAAPGKPAVIAMDCTPDRTWGAFAVADSRVVEVVDHRRGVGWMVDRAFELWTNHGVRVVVDGSGPAGNLGAEVERLGATVEYLGSRDVARACNAFYDDVNAARFTVLDPFGTTTAAVSGAVKKPSGETWRWDRNADADISPLMAVTLARFSAGGSPKDSPVLAMVVGRKK